MQPRIIESHDAGFHNADLAKTSLRLLEGGSWKRQRVIVILPADATMSTRVALSHWGLMFPPNQGVHKMLAQGFEVGDAYSSAIEQILAHPDLKDWEFILTIEHDNIPPGDGVLKLIAQMEKHPEFSAIGGGYFCKGPQGCFHCWGDIKDPVLNFRPQVPRPGELMECYGVSMGMTLFRLKMFHDTRLKKPWFRTIASAAEGIGTQDLAFWADARKYGYRCAVDTDVKTGHHDLTGAFGIVDFVW